MNSGLDLLQMVIYTSSLDLSDKLGLAQELRRGVKAISIFEGEPTILPLPEDSPSELPRIILKNQDGSFSLNISPARTDLFYKSKDFDEQGISKIKLQNIEAEMIDSIIEIATLLRTKFTSHIHRAAIIVNHLVKLKESSRDFLSNNFLKKNVVVDKPYDIQLNFGNKKTIDGFKINEWVRFHTLRSKKNPEDDTAFMLILDINSLIEVDYNFTEANLKSFFEKSFRLANKEVKIFSENKVKNG